MEPRRLILSFSCLALLTNVEAVLADGKLFIWRNKDADIFQPSQKAYIRWDGSDEKLVLQSKYEAPAEEMVWIVPVPSEPKVEKGDPNLFEKLSRDTQDPDLSYTDFAGLRMYPGGLAPPPLETVKWRRRIGDYDVVLLSPVGAEHVIRWLNSNEFGVPDEAVPILNDYVGHRWWMIAARIHRQALTDLTREKLAEGTLHPLEMTFRSSKCVYPLRLTGLAAGPVEELIYIEGPTHYEPVTLGGGNWEIDVFGGPGRLVPNEESLSPVEHALEVAAGRTTSYVRRYLTKLRRVFKPEEMTEDIIFGKIDYIRLIASGVPLRIGQAATQYGRHRDPNGIPHLLKSLSPEQLEQVRPAPEDYQKWVAPSGEILSRQGLQTQQAKCKHLRSCIWAIGEIAVEHKSNGALEETLLRCAQHENQLVRMEAYIALMKLGSKKLGAILLDRFTRVFGSRPAPIEFPWYELDSSIVTTEMDIIAEWIGRFGEPQEKETFVKLLSAIIGRLPSDFKDGIAILGWQNRVPHGWPGWVIWQAALTQDVRLLQSLQNFRAKVPDKSPVTRFLLEAEAACDSSKAVTMVARRIVEDQSKIEFRTARGFPYFPSMGPGTSGFYLREWILERLEFRRAFSRMPPKVNDIIMHTALSSPGLNDWYVLYLLARIEEPQPQDKERIRIIWDNNDEQKRLVAVDILWFWKDSRTLLELRGQCTDEGVGSEIQRALDSIEKTTTTSKNR